MFGGLPQAETPEDPEVLLPSTIEAKQTLAIGLGLAHYLIDSEGGKTSNPHFLRQSQL
ncbi:MAG: hypothetical protein ACPGF7_06380 [Pontibacterium sp.]